MIRTFLLAILLSLLTGGVSGAYVTWQIFGVAQMKQKLRAYEDGQRKFADALHLSEELDDQADAVERKNQEVLDAIRKTRTSSTAPHCLDAGRLRQLSRLH